MAGELKVTTAEMISALYRRYPQSNGRWANVVEFEKIDFLSVACWASLKYAVHGHEIKVSRSDWLRELKQPHKTRSNRPMCDFWWLAAPRGIARAGEIPDGWGFIEWNGYSFRVVKSAPVIRPPYNNRAYLAGGGPDLSNHYSRRAFAMLARRFAYAQTDADALMTGIDDPTPYLDRSAIATGRITSAGRQDNIAWRKRMRELNKQHRRS